MKIADKADNLPPLREVIRDYGLRAEKSLGQNFILDQNLTDKIVRASGDITNLNIIEIGPGPGGLSRSIMRAAPFSFTAIEYDRRAIEALQSLHNASEGKMTILQADALETDLTRVTDPPRAIIANLPYNIATTLLISWLRQIRGDPDSYDHMTLMFQKEVAQRIVAPSGTKAFGRLSVIAQWLCDVHAVFDLPPSAFVPPPKVTSTVVHFKPKILPENAPDFASVEAVTAAAFGQRRKMIRGSLKNYCEAIAKAGLDETLRAEDLAITDFLKIAQISSS